MSKRFTDTDKWKDKWFRSLKPNEKLVFLYLIDNCNLAGFIEIDTEMIAFQTGLSEREILGAIKGLNRGCLGANEWIWVKNFLRHQKNENLNPKNNAHKHIINLINSQIKRFSNNKEFKLFLGANQGLFSPIGKGKGKGKDKDISTNLLKDIHPLQKYILENLPNVSNLKEQITKTESEKIIKNFGKDLIVQKLDAMENTKTLTKKYVSVYRTLNNWCKMELERTGGHQEPKKWTEKDLKNARDFD